MSIFTSYNLPSTITPNSVPSADWQDPSNILLVNGLFAVASGPANILEVGTFNLAVPYAATVLGITLQLKGYQGVNPVNLSIYAVDDISGVSYAYPLAPAFSGFDGVNTLYTLTATLFGTTWNSDQINNIKFRLIADNPLYMDAILVRAEYVPAVVPPPIPTPAADIVVDEFVQAQPFNFAQALGGTDLFLFLETFNYPDGTAIQYADFHTTTEAYLVLNQGIPDKEEVVRFTNVEQDYGGSGLCRISFTTLANRGLGFQWPYASVSSLIVTHDSTSQAVLSNPAVFYRRFIRTAQIGALVSAPIEVDQNDALILKPATKLNFKGSGVSVTADGTDPEMVDIQIDGSTPLPPLVVGVGSVTTGSTPASSVTFLLTSSGVNRGMLFEINTDSARTVVSATFNGVSATSKVVRVNNTLQTQQWFLLAPTLGTHSVVITLDAPGNISAGAVALQAVNQTTPTGATSTSFGGSTSPTITDTTTVDFSIVFDSLVMSTSFPATILPLSEQSTLWTYTVGADIMQGGASYITAGSHPDAVTSAYTISPSAVWAMTAIEIIGVPPVPPSSGVVTVTGNVVDNTDPHNPVVTAVKTVTGLNTDNTDPENPIVHLSVGSGLSGLGTPASPLTATGGGGGNTYTVNADETEITVITNQITPPPAVSGSFSAGTSGPWQASTGGGGSMGSGSLANGLGFGTSGFGSSEFRGWSNLMAPSASSKYQLGLDTPNVFRLKFYGILTFVTSGSLRSAIGFSDQGNGGTFYSEAATAENDVKFVMGIPGGTPTIFAVCSNGSAVTAVNLSIDPRTFHLYEIVVTPYTNAKFYVDGILEATITTHLYASASSILWLRVGNFCSTNSDTVSFDCTLPIFALTL